MRLFCSRPGACNTANAELQEQAVKQDRVCWPEAHAHGPAARGSWSGAGGWVIEPAVTVLPVSCHVKSVSSLSHVNCQLSGLCHSRYLRRDVNSHHQHLLHVVARFCVMSSSSSVSGLCYVNLWIVSLSMDGYV